MADVTVSREIAASPDAVWALVSDLPKMGDFSPENDGGEWIKGATGPAVGAAFKGANHNGKRKWKTVSTITAADPGSRLAFDVKVMGLTVAQWEYTIEPTDGGCTVTESWTDRRPGFFKPLGKAATGVGDRISHNQAGMEQTLERLAAAAEGGADAT